MKLLQLNIWGGRLTKRIIRLLLDEQPDIICMQEVFSSGTSAIQVPDNFFNSLERLVADANLRDVFLSSLYSLDYAGHRIERGNAIASMQQLRNRDTMFVQGTYRENVDPTDTTVHRDEGPYNLQLAEVVVAEKSVTIANHHGYWQSDPIGNKRSVECMTLVADRLRAVEGPLILAGDLNVTAASPAMRVFDDFLEDLTETRSVTSTLGKLHFVDNVACDHILISPGVKVTDFRVVDPLVSDHQALILEFEL